MKKYQIIYADPPWSYGRATTTADKRGIIRIEKYYPTLSEKQLCELKVNDISDNDCALFMWTTDAHLEIALNVIKNWGFKYKTIAFVWSKRTSTGKIIHNLAPWIKKNVEICLFATKGKMTQYKKSNSVQQLLIAERDKHSKKPEEIRKRIEQLFGDLPRIELFARQKTDGWDTWGNEIENDIELTPPRDNINK